jgi:hypothetical protein
MRRESEFTGQIVDLTRPTGSGKERCILPPLLGVVLDEAAASSLRLALLQARSFTFFRIDQDGHLSKCAFPFRM